MSRSDSVLLPKARIHGGVMPGHYKNTAESPSVVMPPPKFVTILMSQHIGAACVPCVKKGDKVFVGTKIGDSDRLVSAPIHSSVSGTVSDIVDFLSLRGTHSEAVVIESDGEMTPDPSIAPITVTTHEELVAAARECGLVGLGGAGFPAHVKLAKGEKPLDYLIINGAECEPFITTDYRECIENPRDIFEGVYLLKKIMGIKEVVIAIEENKPKAIEILHSIASDAKDSDGTVNIMKLKSRYPQGAEKTLIYTVTGRKLPLGKLPAEVGCVVMNITSIATLNRYIRTGMPLVSKRLTVDGGAISKPCNVIVPIGTSVKDVIEFCGGLKGTAERILFGGPMMGVALENTDTPVLKQNNAILALTKENLGNKRTVPCICCGRCISACPMGLNPSACEKALSRSNTDEIAALHAEYCIECGSCSYICPSARPLTQAMQVCKDRLRKTTQKGGK